jgi:threonyl-tRNA synthetase
MERFIGILIEHHGGKFPLWLAPVQARVLTITDAQNVAAGRVHGALLEAGLRAELDDSSDKIGAKIRTATLDKVPYMLVIGPREAETGEVSVRERSGRDLGPMTVGAFVEQARVRIRDRS